MNKLIFVFLTISIFANSKISLQDRKKNFDTRLNQISNLSDLTNLESIKKDISELKNKQIEIDSFFRSGEREKLNSTLANAESSLSKTGKEMATSMKQTSKELLDDYSMQNSSSSEKDKIEKKKLTVDENVKREKASSYLAIARSDFSNGIKFERDKNVFYSIQLYKRSIDYIKLAYTTNEYKIPEKFLEKKEDDLKHTAKKAN